jgi:hypothetical protein
MDKPALSSVIFFLGAVVFNCSQTSKGPLQSVSFSLFLPVRPHIICCNVTNTLSGQDQLHSSHTALQAEFKSQNEPASDGDQRSGHPASHTHTLSLLGTTSNIHKQKPTIKLPKAILLFRSVFG